MQFKLTIGILILCFFAGTFPDNPVPFLLISPTFVQAEDSRQGVRNEVTDTGKKSSHASLSFLKTEVAGFSLEGTKPWETLKIEDLDTLVTPSGKRLLPLLRLLKALQVDTEETRGIFSFNPTGAQTIVLDIQKKEIQRSGQITSVSLVEGVSDVTAQREIYLPHEVLSDILLMKIEWDEMSYSFAANTNQKLKIWKISPGVSLLAIQTKEASINLPERLPPAHPPYVSLDFIEIQFRPYFTTSGNASSGSSNRIAIDLPTQTFWGSSFSGRYKLKFSEPWASWDDVSGFQKADSSPIMLNWGEWTYSPADAEISAGDSVFGLNDLTFPVVRMSGIRFNGLAGFPADDDQWRASPGISNYFITPQVFEGTAPVGSKVELVVNDRSIETQQVSVGTYRFEEIRLTPGSLNNIKINITEHGGFQRTIEKNILGRSLHLPRGGLAYLGGLGTNRQVYDWTTRGIIGGGRILFGVNDSLTLGTTWAGQERFYLPINASTLASNEREYPQSSLHWGGQFAWLPSEHLNVGGDVSLSSGSGGQGSWNGMAYTIKGDAYPIRNMQILSQFFHYGPDFFNGTSINLRDREGYAFNGRWNINQKWSAFATVGDVWNNLDGNSDKPLSVNFQNMEISSTIINKMTIAFGANRAAANWAEGPMTLYTLKVQASPSKDVYFDGQFSQGDYLQSGQGTDFFSGLRIPGFSVISPPRALANLRIPITSNSALGALYWDSPGRQRASILHNFTPWDKPIRLYTELGYDAYYQQPFIQNRTDYLLDRSGRKSIGIDARYEQGQWTASLLFSFTELFSHSRNVVQPVPDATISPDRAGVHGRVFIDANANGIMDPGEPGVENIQVILDNSWKVLTDKNGYFLISSSGQSKKCRLFIDVSTVPAIYSPTHAIQTAYLGPKSLTEINFGITPNHSMSGNVQLTTPDHGLQPLPGVRVYLKSVEDDRNIMDSITDKYGGYYLGDIRPGKYYLQVDPDALSPKFILTNQQKRTVEIVPAIEPQELKIPPLLMTHTS